MKAFSTLTRRGQIQRVRRMAESVLGQYPLGAPRLEFIAHSFNTTFCVHSEERETSAPQEGTLPRRYLLRIHREGFHGTTEQTRRIVQSEMRWLSALRQESDLVVPQPVESNDGAFTVLGHHEAISQARVCSLLRWVKGRSYARSAKAIHLYRLGELTAQLHNHAAGWTTPTEFVRPRWDWDALFGDGISFTKLRAPEVWALIPDTYRPVFEGAAIALQQAMAELGESGSVWGLIHADLHLDNVIFVGDEARPIDFDDCGFGHWLYDIAVALWELRLHRQWEAFRDAFFEGYARYRPLPQEQLAYLDIFIAGRETTIGLGTAATTEEFPQYRKYLEEDMRRVAEFIQAIPSAGLRQMRSPR